jgi:hypothetical protein
MGQVFRINIKGSNFHFQLLKLKQSDRNVESEVLLQGSTVTLCKNASGSWSVKEDSSPVVNELVQAIGNSIALRYRV